MVNSPHFLGYSRLGAEITALKPDYREQFDVSLGCIVSSDIYEHFCQFATELPAPGPDEPLYRNVVGPNQVRSYIWSLCPSMLIKNSASGRMKRQSPDFGNLSTHICLK